MNSINKCYKCDTELSDERVHLGFDSCLECSGTEKYSSHTVYPHKTGGYIQPVSSEKSDELKRLDRRAATKHNPKSITLTSTKAFGGPNQFILKRQLQSNQSGELTILLGCSRIVMMTS